MRVEFKLKSGTTVVTRNNDFYLVAEERNEQWYVVMLHTSLVYEVSKDMWMALRKLYDDTLDDTVRVIVA